jgi:hypothetical protein
MLPRARITVLISCFSAFAAGLSLGMESSTIPWWVQIALCAWNLLVLGVIDGRPSKTLSESP